MTVRLAGVTAVTALALTALLGTAGAAQAAAQSAGRGGHCVLDLTSHARVTCFDTFSGAIAHATGGAVRLPAAATTVEGRYLTALRKANAGAAGVVAVGTLYNDAHYGGHTWTVTRSTDCDSDADVDWSYQNLQGVRDSSGFSWNDEIGSAVQYGQCEATYYEHADYQGASVTGNWSGGALDDEVSSIEWR